MIEKVVIALIVLFGVLFVWQVFEEAHAEKIVLKKADWECTAAQTHLQPIWTGLVMVLNPVSECTQYRRK